MSASAPQKRSLSVANRTKKKARKSTPSDHTALKPTKEEPVTQGEAEAVDYTGWYSNACCAGECSHSKPSTPLTQAAPTTDAADDPLSCLPCDVEDEAPATQGNVDDADDAVDVKKWKTWEETLPPAPKFCEAVKGQVYYKKEKDGTRYKLVASTAKYCRACCAVGCRKVAQGPTGFCITCNHAKERKQTDDSDCPAELVQWPILRTGESPEPNVVYRKRNQMAKGAWYKVTFDGKHWQPCCQEKDCRKQTFGATGYCIDCKNAKERNQTDDSDCPAELRHLRILLTGESPEPNVVYRRRNRQAKGAWHKVRWCGNHWQRCCRHEDCDKYAVGSTDCCVLHGGGVRCEMTDVHLGDPPTAGYRLSASAALEKVPKPEYEGKRVCLFCKVHLDSDDGAIKTLLRREQFVAAGIADVLHARGRDDLVDRQKGVVTADCPAGPSRRRADVAFDLSDRMTLLVENDEEQHADRTQSCEDRKLAGHLVDLGAVAYTKEEGALWADGTLDDLALARLEGTADDTAATGELRKRRAAATQRVLREFRAKHRAAGGEGGSVVARKLYVLRFNCDKYDAHGGVRVGGLFTKVTKAGSSADPKLKPNERFQPAIERLADRILKIIELERDDAWFAEQKDLTVEYRRYNGCSAKTGRDTHGAAYAAIEAKRQAEKIVGGHVCEV